MECKSFSEILQDVEKFNPYHDRLGRFTSGGSATSFTFRTRDPSKQHWADKAVEREKLNGAGGAGSATTSKPQSNRKTPKKKQEEESPRMKVVHGIEDRIRKQNFETAAVIDDDGNEVIFKNGQRAQVGFTQRECMMMANKTMTHNHPRCSMFSDADLKCMAVNNLYEMRATNRDGTTYSIKRGAGGYTTQKGIDFALAYEKEYPKANAYAQRDLDNRGFDRKLWSGEISQAEANIEFGRSSAKYMIEYTKREAPKYGLEFSVEQRAVGTKKSMRWDVMKSNDDYMVLDKDTNELEQQAFNEWLQRTMANKPKTAKSFNDIIENE